VKVYLEKGWVQEVIGRERPSRTKSQSSRRAQVASFPNSYLLTCAAHKEEFEFVGEETNRRKREKMAQSSSSSSLSPKSDAEVEEMLDRMLTRLALCDDSKLEPLLVKLLPLCISSLSSQSLAVRNKVLHRPISIPLFLNQTMNA